MAPNFTFYSAAATLFPLLFIALTITGKLLTPREEQKVVSQIRALVQTVAIFGVYVAGEVVALGVLLDGKADDWQRPFVQSALAVAAWFVLVAVLADHARKIGPVADEIVQWGVSLGLLAIVAVLLFG